MKPQNESIIKYLILHKRGLTPIQALDKFGCFRLASRIWELKQDGYDISKANYTTKSGKTVARYYIE